MTPVVFSLIGATHGVQGIQSCTAGTQPASRLVQQSYVRNMGIRACSTHLCAHQHTSRLSGQTHASYRQLSRCCRAVAISSASSPPRALGWKCMRASSQADACRHTLTERSRCLTAGGWPRELEWLRLMHSCCKPASTCGEAHSGPSRLPSASSMLTCMGPIIAYACDQDVWLLRPTGQYTPGLGTNKPCRRGMLPSSWTRGGFTLPASSQDLGSSETSKLEHLGCKSTEKHERLSPRRKQGCGQLRSVCVCTGAGRAGPQP